MLQFETVHRISMFVLIHHRCASFTNSAKIREIISTLSATEAAVLSPRAPPSRAVLPPQPDRARRRRPAPAPPPPPPPALGRTAHAYCACRLRRPRRPASAGRATLRRRPRRWAGPGATHLAAGWAGRDGAPQSLAAGGRGGAWRAVELTVTCGGAEPDIAHLMARQRGGAGICSRSGPRCGPGRAGIRSGEVREPKWALPTPKEGLQGGFDFSLSGTPITGWPAPLVLG